MGEINYFSGVVKVLENPIQSFSDDEAFMVTFRVEVPQIRQNTMVLLVFWNSLAAGVRDYYQINDYIFIEGYISVEKRNFKLLDQSSKKIVITVLKAYPFFLT